MTTNNTWTAAQAATLTAGILAFGGEDRDAKVKAIRDAAELITAKGWGPKDLADATGRSKGGNVAVLCQAARVLSISPDLDLIGFKGHLLARASAVTACLRDLAAQPDVSKHRAILAKHNDREKARKAKGAGSDPNGTDDTATRAARPAGTGTAPAPLTVADIVAALDALPGTTSGEDVSTLEDAIARLITRAVEAHAATAETSQNRGRKA